MPDRSAEMPRYAYLPATTPSPPYTKPSLHSYNNGENGGSLDPPPQPGPHLRSRQPSSRPVPPPYPPPTISLPQTMDTRTSPPVILPGITSLPALRPPRRPKSRHPLRAHPNLRIRTRHRGESPLPPWYQHTLSRSILLRSPSRCVRV